MTQTREEIGFEHKGIGAVLSQNRLAVPLNQREYSWEEEHVRDLFEDFGHAIDSGSSTYFLGTIVLTHGEGELPEVSDGQQRLATTTILIAAIRDYFFQNNDHIRASAIEQEFLKKTDINTTETVPQLQLNVDDNEFFTKFILATPNTKERGINPTKESHKRIKKAAEIAAQHITSLLAPYTKESARSPRLLEWLRFIKDGAQVILLRVPDHLNAFVMFETLNDRGLKASQADLLKNHLLSLSGNRIKEGQQKWASMIGILETIGRDDITVTYLHHLLITKHGPITGREVFDKVKQTVNSQGRSIEFLDELMDGASDYAALFNPDHKKWNEFGTSTRKHISTINHDLRVEQIRPLMFAVSRHFPIKEGILAFQLFVFWSVRFLIVGGRGGFLDRNYAVAAQEVASGRLKTAKALILALKNAIPSDSLFEAAFSEARVSQAYLARYYLRALELKAKGQNEPELVPSDEEQSVNLEHILPENPGELWPEIDTEIASAYYRRLGNMVILQAKKNSMIGNSKFSDKKSILKDSAFALTVDVTKNTNWGPKEISDRQKQLAKLAVQTWPTGI
jgi:hypothetical protein